MSHDVGRRSDDQDAEGDDVEMPAVGDAARVAAVFPGEKLPRVRTPGHNLLLWHRLPRSVVAQLLGISCDRGMSASGGGASDLSPRGFN